MNIKVIAEHSIDTDLLSGGICIDGGCRGFQFSEQMRDLGCKVIAFDIEDLNEPEDPTDISFMKNALMVEHGKYYYVDTADQQAKFISKTGAKKVTGIAIRDLYNDLTSHGEAIDVLKMDIEGSEYFILSDDNFQPVPSQISVEFHEHCFPALHASLFDKCMNNLLKHYIPVKHERYPAHGAGFNYWDSLFIRCDLITTI